MPLGRITVAVVLLGIVIRNRYNYMTARYEVDAALYRELCEALVQAGIKPMATLYHWDLPTALYKKGGWENPDSSVWFEEYTQVVSHALGDLVYGWMTFNEPQMFTGMGYRLGAHAPFESGTSDERLNRITRHVLLAHGKAVSVLRKNCPKALVANMGKVKTVYLKELTDAYAAVSSLLSDILKQRRWQ